MKINAIIMAGIAVLHSVLASTSNGERSTPASAMELDPLEVTATLRESELTEIPGSTAVFDAASLRDTGSEHFQNILQLAPNIGFSGGSARPRFLQVRGIGELDQYDEPVIPSVGFIVDDIDFSGIGSSAGLFDIEQVEILRGPQGSLFGANAMAGLVNLKSTEPTGFFTGKTHLSLGGYNTRSLGLALGGPLTGENISYRLSLHQYYSDGFMENETLGRDDTDKKDEFSGRLKLRWRPSSDFTLDLTGMYLDFDNGYDAFSFENGFKSQSNDPGKDTQETRAASMRATWSAARAFDLISITSAGDTDSVYRFDADWGVADDFEEYIRERKFVSQELRLRSKPNARIFNETTDWVLGVYAKRKDEHAAEIQSYSGFNSDSSNDYRANVIALYGELEYELTKRARLILGTRGEQRNAKYNDTYGAKFSPQDNMYGGNISLQYDLSDQDVCYTTIARGYKGSGFNPDPSTPEDIRVYDKEHLWNYEIGLRNNLLDRALKTEVSVFYTRRYDPQIKWWDPGPPWVPYTINGEKGYNYGADAGATYSILKELQLFVNAGLLKTKIYSDRIYVLTGGREQSHAPGYQFSTGAHYRHPKGYIAHIEITGSDSFQFDNYYNAESHSYEIVNARIGYESQHWAAFIWGNNIFDERYDIRGLNLGDIYTQKGAPANFGATVDCYF